MGIRRMITGEEEEEVCLVFESYSPNAGKRWKPEEVEYLIKAVHRGDTIVRMCVLLGRPYTGVTSKLQQLRYISFDPRTYTYAWNEKRAGRRDPIPRKHPARVVIKKNRVKSIYSVCRRIIREMSKDGN